MFLGKAGKAVASILLVILCRWAGAADHPAVPAQPQPVLRIPVAPLGYLPPSNFYLTYRLSSASLAFFDDAHLLFTFRENGLLRRVPGDPADDDDQQIHALLFDAGSGKILREAQWRMHDRAQYLWPFANGEFLVRMRDTLYLTDASLQLRPYVRIDAPLRSIQVSPDGRWMVVESDDPAKTQDKPTDSSLLGMGKPVRIAVVAAGSHTPALVTDARNAVKLPILGDSILDLLEGKQLSSWVVRALPIETSAVRNEPRTLAELKSGCEPTLEPLSATVALAMACYSGSDQRPVVAISSQGGELWRQTWESKYVWPWFGFAQNGTRFAYESLQVSRPISSFDALYPEDVTAQWVGVYDTDTGKLLLVKDVSPILSAGQNVALSPDGRRFAVLRQGAIEIYDLPPVEPRPAPGTGQKSAAPGK